MTIRDAGETDLAGIVAIYNSTIPSRLVTADLTPVSVASRIAWLRAHDPARRPIWVAEVDGQIVAWLSFDTFYAREAYDGTVMIAIYVGEGMRRQGLGRQLLDRAIEHAPRLGVHTLLGYIFAHNKPSMEFFSRFGFAQWALLPRVANLDGVERDLAIVGLRLTA